MEDLSMLLIQGAFDDPSITDGTARGITEAVTTLFWWAADPAVPETRVAAVVTEAVAKVRTIVERVGRQRAPRIPPTTLEALTAAFQALAGILSYGEDDDDSNNGSDNNNNDDGDDDDIVSFSRTLPHIQRHRLSVQHASLLCTSPLATNAGSPHQTPIHNPLNPPSSPSAAAAAAAASSREGANRVVQGGDGKFRRLGVRGRCAELLRTMTPVEREQAAARTCRYIGLLVLGVWAVSSLLLLGIGAGAIYGFREMNEQMQQGHTYGLLTIALDGLDALYPALLASGTDIRYTGVTIASQFLAELSMTRAVGRYAQDKMMFYDPENYLYEFRAGQQNFRAVDHQVVSVLTPRHYAAICRVNVSYPLMQRNDAVWRARSFVIPQLSPYDCANDATATGVFSTLAPSYKRYIPRVETYRRNPARGANGYHKGFGMSVAVTVDRAALQNILVAPSTLLGTESIFSFVNDVHGWWKRDLVASFMGLDAILLGALLLVGQLFTLPALQFRGHRAVFALALTATSASVMAVAIVVARSVVEKADQRAHLMRMENMARCMSSALTSKVLNKYPEAMIGMFKTLLSKTLKGRLFFLRGENAKVYPPEMQSIADAIDYTDIVNHRYAQTVGVRNGHAYATFSQVGQSRTLVAVDTVRVNRVSLHACIHLAIVVEAVTLVFALAVLYLSPMKRLPLVFGGGLGVLVYRLQLGRIRQLYHVLLAVVVVAAVVGLNLYGEALLQESMTKAAGEMMSVLGATNRAKTLVDICIGSCGFSSAIIGLYFRRGAKNVAEFIFSPMSLPFPSSPNWTSTYLGAQLAMSRLPMAVKGMPSFFTLIANSTTNVIRAKAVVRDLAVVIDINRTHGFVIERLNPISGYAGQHYKLVSQSIGVTVACCVLCLSFTLMEWAFSRLLRLSPSGWLARRASCDKKSTAPSSPSRGNGGNDDDDEDDVKVKGCGGAGAADSLTDAQRATRRRLLRVLYVLSASLLLSSAIIINAGVMRGRMRGAMAHHTDEEMSQVLVAVLRRFETVALSGKLPPLVPLQPPAKQGDRAGIRAGLDSDDLADILVAGEAAPVGEVQVAAAAAAGAADDDSDDSEDLSGSDLTLHNLATALADAQDSLEASVEPFVRWRLLQEWPRFGSDRVRVLNGPEDVPHASGIVAYDAGPLNIGTVPVCRVSDGAWLTPKINQRMRYCYAEVPGGSLDDGDIPPRNFLLLFTEEDSVVEEPAREAGRRVLIVSVMVTLALCLGFAVLAWWFLLACDHHDFSPFACGELLTVQGAIPRAFRSVDMYIPIRFRKRWAMMVTLGLLAVLLYYCATTQLLYEVVDTSETTAIAVWTQQNAVESIIEGASMDAYNYLMAGQAASLASLENRATAVEAGVSGYSFLSPKRQTDLALQIRQLRTTLASLKDLPATQAAELLPSGWDSYQTYIAEQYSSYTASQGMMKGFVQELYEAVGIYFTSNYLVEDAAAIEGDAKLRVKFVDMLYSISQLDDYLTQLFLLDHAAVASYLSFHASVLAAGGTGVAMNNFWPFLPRHTDNVADVTVPIVETTRRIGSRILGRIAIAMRAVRANGAVIFANAPDLLAVTQRNMNEIKRVLPQSCVTFSTMYLASIATFEKHFPYDTMVGTLEAAHLLWSVQMRRSKEIMYINNRSLQSLADKSTGAAIQSIEEYTHIISAPVITELVIRKFTQLHVYLSEGDSLANLQTEKRWEAYQDLLGSQETLRVVFACAVVLYCVWLVACALWYHLARQQVRWWVQGSIRPPPRPRRRHSRNTSSRSSPALSSPSSGAATSGRAAPERQRLIDDADSDGDPMEERRGAGLYPSSDTYAASINSCCNDSQNYHRQNNNNSSSLTGTRRYSTGSNSSGGRSGGSFIRSVTPTSRPTSADRLSTTWSSGRMNEGRTPTPAPPRRATVRDRRRSQVALTILHRFRHRRTLRVFLGLSFCALLPIALIFWFTDHAMGLASHDSGIVSMGLRTVECHWEADTAVRSIMSRGAQLYSTGDTAPILFYGTEVVSAVMRLAHLYMWRAWDDLADDPPRGRQRNNNKGRSARPIADVGEEEGGAGTGDGIAAPPPAPHLARLIETMQQAVGSLLTEVNVFNAATPMRKLPDFHIGLASYAVSLLRSLRVTTATRPNPADPEGPPIVTTTYSYDKLMPLSTTYGDSAVYTYARHLAASTREKAAAATTANDLMVVVRTYGEVLLALDNVAEAQLQMWHMGVICAGDGGNSTALDIGMKVGEELSEVALAQMSDGSREAAAAVAEVRAYFAPMLAVVGTPELVVKHFQYGRASNLPSSETAAATFEAMLSAAGVVSSTLTPIRTRSTFLSLFAYNRGLVPLTAGIERLLNAQNGRRRFTGAGAFKSLIAEGEGEGEGAQGVVRDPITDNHNISSSSRSHHLLGPARPMPPQQEQQRLGGRRDTPRAAAADDDGAAGAHRLHYGGGNDAAATTAAEYVGVKAAADVAAAAQTSVLGTAFVPSVAPPDGDGQLFFPITPVIDGGEGAVASRRVPELVASSSLLDSVVALVARGRGVVSVGVTGEEEYPQGPATRNEWIWSEQVYPKILHEGATTYTDMEYVRGCVLWCGTCAMWITGAALIYLVYCMELLA